jgi:hypothetical protein
MLVSMKGTSSDNIGQNILCGILRYRASPNKVTSRCIVDSLRHKDFAYGVVVTPFGEAL